MVFEKNTQSIEEKMQMHLGAQFKKLFSETSSQPVPERFVSLLDQLETGEVSDQSRSKRPSVVNR
jgi:hypothetical protein